MRGERTCWYNVKRYLGINIADTAMNYPDPRVEVSKAAPFLSLRDTFPPKGARK